MPHKRKKKRVLSPRCKRMNRASRLQSAVSWLKDYKGKNVLKGYCRHFGVDWRCAAVELPQLGVKIDKAYLERRKVTEVQLAAAKKRRKEAQAAAESNDPWPSYDSAFEAYLAGDFAALHAIEQSEDIF